MDTSLIWIAIFLTALAAWRRMFLIGVAAIAFWVAIARNATQTLTDSVVLQSIIPAFIAIAFGLMVYILFGRRGSEAVVSDNPIARTLARMNGDSASAPREGESETEYRARVRKALRSGEFNRARRR